MGEFMCENDIEDLGTLRLDVSRDMNNAPSSGELCAAQDGVRANRVTVIASASTNRLQLSKRNKLDDRLFDERPSRVLGGGRARLQNFAEFSGGQLRPL